MTDRSIESRLLELYDRVVDAPDAVERLRKFVLDLAVRGKLVEQDEREGSAKKLVANIEAEKKQRHKTGRRVATEKLQPLSQEDEPFSLPNSWTWVPAVFPAIPVPDRGKKVKTKEILESGKFPVVDQGKVLIRGYWNDPEKVIRVSQPLLIFGDHTRETKLIDFDFIVGADGVKIFEPICINPSYYYLSISWLPLESRGYGRHFKLLKASTIPLPPLDEQHRIVTKVNELMTLLDRLETTRSQREKTRNRLTTASPNRTETAIALGWEDIQHLKQGKVTKTFTNHTHPTGPWRQTIEYQPPFFRPDREEDYRVAWKVFQS